MILDAILSVLLSVPNMLLDSMGDIVINISEGVFSFLDTVLPYLNYFVPINSLLPLLAIEIAIIGFKIIWAIILRVKSFIPTMGS